MAETLKDCRAVLVSGIGDTPQAVLSEAGVEPVVMNGFIEMALTIYGSGDLSGSKAGAPAWPEAAAARRRGGVRLACLVLVLRVSSVAALSQNDGGGVAEVSVPQQTGGTGVSPVQAQAKRSWAKIGHPQTESPGRGGF